MIWQVDKGKGRWKTFNNSVIALLEDAHQKQSIDIKLKNLVVSYCTTYTGGGLGTELLFMFSNP